MQPTYSEIDSGPETEISLVDPHLYCPHAALIPWCFLAVTEKHGTLGYQEACRGCQLPRRAEFRRPLRHREPNQFDEGVQRYQSHQ